MGYSFDIHLVKFNGKDQFLHYWFIFPWNIKKKKKITMKYKVVSLQLPVKYPQFSAYLIDYNGTLIWHICGVRFVYRMRLLSKIDIASGSLRAAMIHVLGQYF